MKRFFVVTCEHGGNRLPAIYRPLFSKQAALLRSHEGYDKGALKLAREMAAALGGDHHYSIVSRLLVDLNRSIGHPDNLSTITAALDDQAQKQILDKYYHPFRDAVTRSVAAAVDRSEAVLHLSCHSFAEELDGDQRDAEIGLLFDPVRHTEVMLCAQWKAALEKALPGMQVRLNYPYLGVDDGLVTSLRGRYPNPLYAGIELEVRRDVVMLPAVRHALVSTLAGLFSAPAA
ncbi:MAG: N-formylglutamate amidohydrolase [Paucimonas sp.]|nr:N-formylglutamate amidohydrolase [Paucimonas sp.]